MAITHTAHTDVHCTTLQTHTYVRLPCIYLFALLVPLFCIKIQLDQVIVNIFGINEIESQV